jgi:hypothetical protein
MFLFVLTGNVDRFFKFVLIQLSSGYSSGSHASLFLLIRTSSSWKVYDKSRDVFNFLVHADDQSSPKQK